MSLPQLVSNPLETLDSLVIQERSKHHPHPTLPSLSEDQSNWRSTITNIVSSLVSLPSSTLFDTIPTLHSASITHHPSPILVRYRGYIQDMLDPEIIASAVIVINNNNNISVSSGRFRDTLVTSEDTNMSDEAKVVLTSRYPYFVVPVPVRTNWARTADHFNAGLQAFPHSGEGGEDIRKNKRNRDDANGPHIQSSTEPCQSKKSETECNAQTNTDVAVTNGEIKGQFLGEQTALSQGPSSINLPVTLNQPWRNVEDHRDRLTGTPTEGPVFMIIDESCMLLSQFRQQSLSQFTVDGETGLRLGDYIEVIGVLVPRENDMDGGVDDEMMMDDDHPSSTGPSLPRLHALVIRVGAYVPCPSSIIHHPSSTLSQFYHSHHLPWTFQLSCLPVIHHPSSITSSIIHLRSMLLSILSTGVGGDSTTAQLLLLLLISRTIRYNGTGSGSSDGTDDVLIGKLSLCISGWNDSSDTVTETLTGDGWSSSSSHIYSLLSRFIPCCVVIPIVRSLPATSSIPVLHPVKDYATGRLTGGGLQLTGGSVVIVDECKLSEGPITDPKIILAIESLSQLSATAQVNVDYQYFKSKINVDAPTLVLSATKKSLVRTDFTVKLSPTFTPTLTEGLSEDHVLALRAYLFYVRWGMFQSTPQSPPQSNSENSNTTSELLSLSPSLSSIIEATFIHQRQVDKSVDAQVLHSWMTLARLLALSYGDHSLTEKVFMEAVQLERAAIKSGV